MKTKIVLSRFLFVLMVFSVSFSSLAQDTPGTPVDESSISTEVLAMFEAGANLYPDLFAGGSAWHLYDGYTYRYFSGSGVYIGVRDGMVYMKSAAGPLTELGSVGEIAARLHYLALYEVQDVPHGAVTISTYHSSALDRDRQFYVYTPPGYNASGAPYPVLYLLHGVSHTESAWTENGRVNVIMDNLLAQNVMQPFVIVMPYGYADPIELIDLLNPLELLEQREGFNADFLQDVIPTAQAGFNISAEQSKRAVAGLSYGGAQALALGFSHPELFSRIAAFSPAVIAPHNPLLAGVDYDDVLSDSARLNRRLQSVWISSGADDLLFPSIQDLDELLSEHGIEHFFRVTEGAHSWDVWQRNFFEVAPQLFGPGHF